MNTIEIVKSKLKKYPHVEFEENENSIVIYPASENGFEVSLFINDEGFTVYFNGWHERFESENEALECFVFGLSTDCRLKEFRKGLTAYKWTLEYKRNDEWFEESTVGSVTLPTLSKPVVFYLQNELIHD